MATEQTGINQIQRVNLSHSAWNIIDNDMSLFQYESTEDNPKKPLTRTAFLNIIFTNYWDESPANLQYNMTDFQKHYPSMLSNPKAQREYKERLREKYANGYEKGIAIELRLRNNVLNTINALHRDNVNFEIYEHKNGKTMISSKKRMGERMYDTYELKCGRILKGLYETYCTLPYYQRERIFYKRVITEIDNALNIGFPLIIQTEKGAIYRVIPYKIMTDEASNYNYLVGYSRQFHSTGNVDEADRIMCLRISRIMFAKLDYSTKESLTSIQVDEINQKIKCRGVQFLTNSEENDIITAKIRFTEAGLKQYANTFHLRPNNFKKMPNNRTDYEFQASRLQIMYYFFRFGSNVEILEPTDLREQFKNMYEAALKNYL